MFLELLFFALLGFSLGLLTGLLPGLHINSLVLVFPFLLQSSTPTSVAFIISLSLTHAVLDIIPSTLFSAPESEHALSVLPAHRLFLQGKAHLAIVFSVTGMLLGCILTLIFSPLAIAWVQNAYPFLKTLFPAFIVVVLFLFFTHVRSIRAGIFTFITILFSGIFGVLLLSSDLVAEPLYPSMMGLFGGSALLYSLLENPIPRFQHRFRYRMPVIGSILSSFKGLTAGFLTAIFPALSLNVSALLIRMFSGKLSTRAYLIVLGSASISALLGSLFTLLALGLTRTGTAVLVKDAFSLNFEEWFLMAGVSLIAVSFSALFVLYFCRQFLKKFQELPYRLFTIIIFLFLVFLVFAFTQLSGLFVFFLATSIGLIPLLSHTQRSACMAFLLIPTFFLYAGF